MSKPFVLRRLIEVIMQEIDDAKTLVPGTEEIDERTKEMVLTELREAQNGLEMARRFLGQSQNDNKNG